MMEQGRWVEAPPIPSTALDVAVSRRAVPPCQGGSPSSLLGRSRQSRKATTSSVNEGSAPRPLAVNAFAAIRKARQSRARLAFVPPQAKAWMQRFRNPQTLCPGSRSPHPHHLPPVPGNKGIETMTPTSCLPAESVWPEHLCALEQSISTVAEAEPHARSSSLPL